ncbi:MAG: AMP-binding protein [Acidobacteriota bacterium]|nr:AMP-binding protein [Acidobacteriota bacterium]MDE3265357.1 AMP-binding protein [Acidobacteriota bacterium]
MTEAAGGANPAGGSAGPPGIAEFDRSFLPTIEQGCREFRDGVCVVFRAETYTYGEVDELSARIARALAARGFGRGMKGAIYSLNSALAFIAALGLLRAGGTWIPVNPRNSARDNVEILTRFGCEALFFQEAFREPATEARKALGELRAAVSLGGASAAGVPSSAETLDDFIADVPPEAPKVEMKGSDILTIPMTGGTTGLPKGVMLSHRNMLAIEYAMRTRYADRRPVILCAAPMTHVGGRIALTSMTSGARFVILEKVDLQVILRTIEKERITSFFLPPTAIYSLLDQPNLDDFDLSSLESLSYGSAPMSLARLKQALRRFGPIMRGGFGQTECPMFIAGLPQEDHYEGRDPSSGKLAPDRILRSVGRSTVISEVAIMDDDGTILGPGERGEIVVKGPNVSEGYYGDPEETAKIRRNGWHLTGDIGVLDDDGYLTIVDRKKDMIITGGFNVYSTEVEQALLAMPGIALAAVIGVPSERWGEEVRAVVVPAAGAELSEAEVIAAVKERLGGVKAPKSVEFVDDLPRTAVGKIDKKRLREPHWAGRTRQV